MPDVVYTIGHSNHPIEQFTRLLASRGITAVADVRSHPYSRLHPQFNREVLREHLHTAGLNYVFLGRELGARSEDPSCYLNGKAQYDRIARTKLFQEGLARVIQGARRYRIALMCAEKDPLTCHRAILVCRHLTAQGVRVEHILEDGQLESHDEALARLLTELGLTETDLFRTREEVILDAYELRGQQIAYTLHS